MRLKTDENFPSEAVALLRTAGHDVATAHGESLGGRPDAEIAAVCASEGRVLITLDTDFSDIRSYPPADYPGLIVLRIAKQSVPEVLGVLHRLLPVFKAHPCRYALWIVEENRIRIRG
jgi:predicted nuclease of predicted toxin-antitoxin system